MKRNTKFTNEEKSINQFWSLEHIFGTFLGHLN